MFTVIVTGSRDLTDETVVFQALWSVWKEAGESLRIVHGDCPTGADRFARTWCWLWEVNEVRHPANWDLHGKAAGPIRNREMAQAGADLCLAFPLGESRGTWNCVNECKKAGIPVKVIK